MALLTPAPAGSSKLSNHPAPSSNPITSTSSRKSPLIMSSSSPLAKCKEQEVFVVASHNWEIPMAFEPALSCLIQVSFSSFFCGYTSSSPTLRCYDISMMHTSFFVATVSVVTAYGLVFPKWYTPFLHICSKCQKLIQKYTKDQEHLLDML
jgi:hypothetical protein